MELEWTRGHRLGKGSQAEVFMVIHNNPNLPPLVVKSSPVKTASRFITEHQILSEFRGAQGIIQCFGGDKGPTNYDLFLEYAAEGTLTDCIHGYRSIGHLGIPEMHVRVSAAAILEALSLVHSRGYIHCDVKPENILLFPLGEDPNVCELKLADFGLAMKTSPPVTGVRRGTVTHMAPEVLFDGKLSPAMDIWSFACTVIEMLTGEPPWNRCKLDEEVIEEMYRGGQPEIPDWLSEQGKDFLNQCFVRHPKYRLPAAQLLQHPYLAGVRELSSDQTRNQPSGFAAETEIPCCCFCFSF
ncbi:Mitogen-activated protein kinase kinase kinase 20 [Linum grandiflorum]